MFDILLVAAVLAAEAPDATALLRQADAPRQAMSHSSIRIRATVELDDQSPQTAEFDLKTGNPDQQLVVFRDKRARGRKFLMVGDKSWLIVPGSKHPVAVTASQRLVGASSFADLSRIRLSEDYRGRLRAETEPCGNPARTCQVVEIQSTTRTAPYASGTLWIDERSLLRRAVYRLASGKPAKEITYQYRERDGRVTLSGLTLTDLLFSAQSGTTTLVFLDRRAVQHSPGTFDPRHYATPVDRP